MKKDTSKAERLLNLLNDVNESLITDSAGQAEAKKKSFPIKWISVAACLVLIAGICVGILITREPKIEYDYSMIKTHSISSGAECQMPYDVKNLAEFSQGFIEFVVLSEPKEITYEYINQKRIDDAIAQNYSEEDMEIIYREAVNNYTVPCVPIRIENVFYEKEGCNLAQYDEIWLYGDAGAHQESFVPGARFAAYVEIMDDPNISNDVPVELYINSYIYYINENDKLVPFTDDVYLMQYGGYSVTDMGELTYNSAPENRYNYSMIEVHPYESSGMSIPFSYEDMTEWSDGFIEFVVTSESEEVTFEYVNQTSIDVTQEFNVPYIHIETEGVYYEKEGLNLKQYDKLWLFGDAEIYAESFVPGARFAAFVEIMEEDPGIPEEIDLELFINTYIFYIDENDNLIPFTENPNLTQYEGYSVEKMADLVCDAAKKIEERESENDG